MVKTLIATVACMLITAPMAFSQGPEFFIGYSNLQSEGLPERNDPSWVFNTDFFKSRTTLHGLNAAASGYVKGIGFTGDFSFNRKGRSDDFTGGQDVRHTDTFYLLGGPSFKLTHSKLQPFARVMAGAAHTRFKASREFDIGSGATTSSSFKVGATDFAASAGGGIDLRMGESLKLRVLQFDWTPVFLRDRTVDVLGTNGVIQPSTLSGQRQDNFRFAFGVVF